MDFILFPLPFESVLTCKNSTGLRCHVNLVLSGDAQHHGFGPPVVLGGQQPAQRFGKNPEERERKKTGRTQRDGQRVRAEHVEQEGDREGRRKTAGE